MALTVRATELPGVVVVEPERYGDERGFLQERYHAERYAAAGIDFPVRQVNHSRSARGVLRGLHYQIRRPQGKLVAALSGRIFDVAADLRPQSATFRHWVGVELCAEESRQLYIPPGYAHGFCVLSEEADVLYHCSDLYDPEDQAGVRWSDPELAVAWPVAEPLLSERDRALPTLAAARAAGTLPGQP
jgi:dTDP-4-dehydrorhamnose 3,5-epimerase